MKNLCTKLVERQTERLGKKHKFYGGREFRSVWHAQCSVGKKLLLFTLHANVRNTVVSVDIIPAASSTALTASTLRSTRRQTYDVSSLWPLTCLNHTRILLCWLSSYDQRPLTVTSHTEHCNTSCTNSRTLPPTPPPSPFYLCTDTNRTEHKLLVKFTKFLWKVFFFLGE
jgi:hypothetical protein